MSLKDKILNIFNKNNSNYHSEIPNYIFDNFNKTRPKITRKYLCNAPFRNLYFNTDGQVSVCCFNMKYMVGNIKYNSIKEIWSGEKLKALRNSIINFDLSLGCDSCKSELLLNNFEDLHIKFYDDNFKINNLPTSLIFQIDNTCNLECTMCTGDFSSNIFKTREQRNKNDNPYNQAFFTELFKLIPNLKTSLFTGGEPFLINSYFDIWDEIIKTNPDCKIVLQTNGTILNDKIKSILEKGQFHIGVSLDSLNSDLYKKIRVNSDLESTLNNLEYFTNYNTKKNQKTRLSVCVMNENRFEIPEITEYCSNNDLNIEFNTVKFPAKNAIWILNSSELNKIILNYKSYVLPNKSVIHKSNIIKFNNLITKLESWYNISIKWENYTPVRIKTNELEKMQEELINKIEQASPSFNSNNLNSDLLISQINYILNEMPDDDIKLNTLKTINSYSGIKILSNIYRENEESLKLLIKNISKLAEL